MSSTVTAAPAAAPVQSSAPVTAPTQGSGPGAATPPDTTPAAAAAAAPAAVPGITPPNSLLADPPADAPADATPATPDPAAPEPVKYTDLRLPETMSADDPLITAFVEQAGKTGLQQDAVQAVIDTMGPKVQEALTAPLVAWATYQTEQQAAVMADPEIGGAKWAESKAAIATLLGNPLVDPGLLPQLERSGMANNPEMLRTLVRLSKLVTEGGSVSAGNPPGGRKSPAQILYPKQS